jgi:hypothetical protein
MDRKSGKSVRVVEREKEKQMPDFTDFTPKNFYFTADGNYGGDELLMVDVAGLADEHLLESVESLTSDNSMLDFVKWFIENDHARVSSSDSEPCEICNENA